jgi:hypothetical protein
MFLIVFMDISGISESKAIQPSKVPCPMMPHDMGPRCPCKHANVVAAERVAADPTHATDPAAPGWQQCWSRLRVWSLMPKNAFPENGAVNGEK